MLCELWSSSGRRDTYKPARSAALAMMASSAGVGVALVASTTDEPAPGVKNGKEIEIALACRLFT